PDDGRGLRRADAGQLPQLLLVGQVDPDLGRHAGEHEQGPCPSPRLAAAATSPLARRESRAAAARREGIAREKLPTSTSIARVTPAGYSRRRSLLSRTPRPEDSPMASPLPGGPLMRLAGKVAII